MVQARLCAGQLSRCFRALLRPGRAAMFQTSTGCLGPEPLPARSSISPGCDCRRTGFRGKRVAGWVCRLHESAS